MITVKLENIKIRQDLTDNEVLQNACEKFNIQQESVIDYKIVKKSIDARDKSDIFYNYSIVVSLSESFKVENLLKNKNANLIKTEVTKPVILNNELAERCNDMNPVIIGAGPAGWSKIGRASCRERV